MLDTEVKAPSRWANLLARVKTSGLANRVASGVGWNLAGAVISRGLSLVASICIARLLSRDGFGEYGILHSTIVMTGVFVGLGMGTTGRKMIGELRESSPERVGKIIGLSAVVSFLSSVLLAALLALFAPFVAERLLGGASSLVLPLRICGIVIVLNALLGVQSGILSGFEAFRQDAVRAILSSVFTFPVVLAGTYYFGVAGAILGLGTGALVNLLLAAGVVRRYLRDARIRVEWRRVWDELPVLWRFSLPVTIAAVLMGPVTWVCNLILVNAPQGYAQMAVIEATNNGRMLVLFVPGQIMMVFLPILSNMVGRGDAAGFRRVSLLNLVATTGATVLVALPLVLIPEPIMGLFGAAYHGTGLVLALMALAMVVRGICDAMQIIYYSRDRVWLAAVLNGVWAVLTIALTWYCVQVRGLGAYGYVLALLLATVARAVLQGLWMPRLLRLPARETARNAVPQEMVE